MQKPENENKEMIENSQVLSPSYNMPETKQSPLSQTGAKPMMKYQMVYPEIFYKLQPYIMMVCDQMDYGFIMPNMEMVQQLTDSIYDDICRMYPDLAEYAKNNDNNEKDDPPFDRGFDGPGRGFRRRGLFRDVIDILLISELFNRRRRSF